jgi:spore maturation protein SpmB
MSIMSFLESFSMRITSSKGLYNSIIEFCFYLLTFFIGSSRIRDYRHRVDDILWGFFIGFIFSIFVWFVVESKLFEMFQEDELINKTILTNFFI